MCNDRLLSGRIASSVPVPLSVSRSVSARKPEPLHKGPRTVALVPAAGRGLRMGGPVPKQFLALGGRPILVQSLIVLQASPVIHEIIWPSPIRTPILSRSHRGDGWVPQGHQGGAGREQRQDSVRHALAEVGSETDIVLVHDAVQPFLTETMIRQVVGPP